MRLVVRCDGLDEPNKVLVDVPADRHARDVEDHSHRAVAAIAAPESVEHRRRSFLLPGVVLDHVLERYDGFELLNHATCVGLVEREAAGAVEADAAPPVVLGQDGRILPEDVGRRLGPERRGILGFPPLVVLPEERERRLGVAAPRAREAFEYIVGGVDAVDVRELGKVGRPLGREQRAEAREVGAGFLGLHGCRRWLPAREALSEVRCSLRCKSGRSAQELLSDQKAKM
mmetsp:Transcript_1364/g.3144  ORF Transcript_1364/g.3144 Transcript_1364/m.3144 type:complete len:230 (+) Transcript_1364:201-890(+)